MPTNDYVLIEVGNDPLIPHIDGLELVHDNGPRASVEAKISEFLVDGEEEIRGDLVRERTRQFALGQRYAYSLLANQEKIPVAWREYDLLFPTTVWRVTANNLLHFPYLQWRDDINMWYMHVVWMSRRFRRHNRVLAPRK